jgi:hypothetical protein
MVAVLSEKVTRSCRPKGIDLPLAFYFHVSEPRHMDPSSASCRWPTTQAVNRLQTFKVTLNPLVRGVRPTRCMCKGVTNSCCENGDSVLLGMILTILRISYGLYQTRHWCKHLEGTARGFIDLDNHKYAHQSHIHAAGHPACVNRYAPK